MKRWGQEESLNCGNNFLGVAAQTTPPPQGTAPESTHRREGLYQIQVLAHLQAEP